MIEHDLSEEDLIEVKDNVIPFGDVLNITMEESEMALAEKNYPMALEFFQRADTLYRRSEKDNPEITSRRNNLLYNLRRSISREFS